ncbi:MAG: hypothetical protein Q9159_005606 [Coniocarpon cinnabarinum]
MSGRGRGGKFGKPKRGGAKKFSRNLRPIGPDGEEMSMWADPKDKKSDDEDDDSDDDSSEEDSDEDEDDDEGPGPAAEQSREERKAEARKRKEVAIAKKKKKQAAPGDMPTSSEDEDDEDEDIDDDMPANPNHTVKAQKQAAAPMVAKDAEPPASSGKKKADTTQLSRREREALQAQQAKERYQKLHAEGKTDEARADLERLKLVREERERAAERKREEAAERAEHEKEKKEQLDRMERQAQLKANKLGNKKKKGAK